MKGFCWRLIWDEDRVVDNVSFKIFVLALLKKVLPSWKPEALACIKDVSASMFFVLVVGEL